MTHRVQGFAAGFVCLALCASAVAKEEKVSLDQVPDKVVKAEKAKWPTAQIVLIEREEDGGKTIYEFGLKQAARKWDASFTADGALVAVEETISEKNVPEAVKKALVAKYPQAKVTLVEKIIEGQEPAAKTFYEYKIKAKDQNFELKFDPTGKLISQEEKKGDDAD